MTTVDIILDKDSLSNPDNAPDRRKIKITHLRTTLTPIIAISASTSDEDFSYVVWYDAGDGWSYNITDQLKD